MATAGSIVIDLLAKTGSFETDMNRARKKVTEFDNDLKGMIARLDRASVAIAGVAAAAAGGWVALTMQTVKAMDATAKMAQQIGVTTESLTSLRFAAQQFANVSDQTFDMALRRMTRRIEEAAQGSGGAKAAFEAMGLSAKELARLSPDQQFMRIADAMQKTDTQAQRLKNTMAIFDTEGMPLVNALSQGSKELERNIELATRYGVVLSTEAARSAEQLTDNLSRLSSIQDGMRQQLTTAMLPALERLSGYMLGVAESALEVGNSRHRLEEFSRVAVEFVDDLARSYAGLTVIGRGVLDMLAELDDAALGWLEPFKAETVAATTVLTQSFSESILNTAREIDKLVGLAGGVMAVWETVGDNIPLYFRVAWNKVLEGAAAFVNSLSDLVNPMLETMGMDGFGKVAWGENVVVGLRGISESFREGYESAKAASGMAERVQTAFDGVAVSAAKTAQAVDGSTGGLAGNRKASESARKAAEAFRKEQERALVAQYQSISAIHAQAQGIEDQVALFGLSKSALEDLTIARLEEEAVVLRMYGDRSKDAVEAIEAEIEARKRLRTAIGSLEQKEAEKAAWQSWAQDVEQIFNRVGQSLTDAIFDGGKSGKELLKDVFKGLTFNILINPVMGAMQGWVTNQLGGMFGYQNPQQQGGGGILGLAQHANTLNTLGGGIYQAMTGAASGASTLSLHYANMVGAMGGDSIGALIAANGGWEGAALASGLAGSGTMAGITSVAPGVAASLTGGGAGAGAYTMTSVGFESAVGGTALAGGGAAGGATLTGTLAAAAPWVLGGLAIASAFGLFDDGPPKTRHGQRTTVDYIDGAFGISQRDDRQAPGAEQIALAAAQGTVTAANEAFAKLGIDAAIDNFYAIMESSVLGDRDGVASGGTLRVGDELRNIGIGLASDMTIAGFGGWSDAEMLPRLHTDIQMTVLEAFQSVGDELPGVLSDMLDGVWIRGLNESDAQELAARFAAVVDSTLAFQAAVEQLPFENLRDLSFDAAAGLIAAAGGLENLNAGMTSYYQTYYSEAEQLDRLSQQISASFAGIGMEMPDVTQGAEAAKQAFRALFESIDPTTEAGQQAAAMMLGVNQSFAQLVTGLEGAAADATNALREREQLERQLLQLQGNTAELRRRELEALDESNHALQRYIWALQDQQSAWDTAVAAGESAFSALSRSVSAEKSRLQKESQAIADALRNSISAASTTVNELTSLTGRLSSTVQRMIGQTLDEGRSRAWAQDRIDRALSVAKLTGIMPSGPDFEQALQLVAQPSEGLFSSFEDYQADFLRTAHTVSELNELAEGQLSTDRRALRALEEQLSTSQNWYQSEMERLDLMLEQERQALDIAMGTYQGVLSIPDAIAGVTSAISALAAAQAAAAKPVPGGGGGGGAYPSSSTAPGSPYDRAGDYYAANPDVATEWNTGNTGMSFDQYAQWHYDNYGKGEGRSYDVGTPFVPYDMTANIHRGEIIIDPRSSDILRRYGIGVQGGAGGSDPETKALLRQIVQRLGRLDEIERHTYDAARTNRQMTEQPQPVAVTNIVPTVAVTPGT